MVANPKTGTVVRNALFSKGQVSFEAIATLTGRIKILTLTPTGAALLGAAARARRHGGAAHEYWREQCRRWMAREGYIVTKEHPVGDGRTVDLHGKRHDEAMIIEIETGKSDIPATLTKLAGLKGRRVLFLVHEELRTTHQQVVAASPEVTVWTPRNLQQEQG